MNHRYILSAFHPRDFNSFDYGSLFHVHFVFAFTAALPFKNCCFFMKLGVAKTKRWLITHEHCFAKKTLFFIRFDVAQTKTGCCMFWVACFASLHTGILTSLVIVNHTWYSKCIPSQQIQWFVAFFLRDQFVVSSLMLIWWLSHSMSIRRKGFLPGINEARWSMLWVTSLVNLCSGISVVYWFHVL